MKKVLLIIVCVVLLVAVIAGVAFLVTSCIKENDGEREIVNLTYNGEVITWSKVAKAKNYKVTINGEEKVVSQPSVRYDAKGEDFDFFVEAVVKEGSDKNPTYSIRFENIGEVKNLMVKDGNLVWDTHETAEKYEIMYNGEIVSSDVGTASYPISVGEFSYKVRPIKGYAESPDGNNPYYAHWSEAVTGTMLSAPENLSYDSEKLKWDKVESAKSYVVIIGTEEFATTTTEYAYAIGTDDFEVSVYAVGDEKAKIYSSAPCEKKTYKYIDRVEGLSVTDGKVIWNTSEGAVKYRIKVNGMINAEDVAINEFSAISSGASYRIQVLPIGKDETYFSRWSEEITVNILRSPVVSYTDGNIRWNQVNGCSGYELKIEKDGEVIHTQTMGQETFVYSYAFEKAGAYNVYVKANALEGSGYYESKYSDVYPVTRLAAPTDEVIQNQPLEANQLSISFTPVTGATSYELLADDITVASTRDSSTFSVNLERMASKTEESVVNFKIIARGGITNKGAVLDCQIPLEFNVTRLATPQNILLNGNQVSWDAVNNTSKYVVTIGGKRTEVSGTSMKLADIAAGNQEVYVQAMGDGEAVITSGLSNSIPFTKLSKPTAININTNGIMSWGAVSGATGYTVIIGAAEYNADGASLDILGYLNTITEGTGTQVSVYARGNGSNVVDSDVSDTGTVSRYTRPSTVKITSGNLTWASSSVDSINCNSYKIIIVKDGVQQPDIKVTGTSYSMSNFEGGNYEIRVVALGDFTQTLDSPESNSFTFNKLADITNFQRVNGRYEWDYVPGATSYAIKLSKDDTWRMLDTNSYTPDFTREGEYEISIRAVGNGSDIVDSDIHTFKQRVNAMSTPVYQESMVNANAFKIETYGNTMTVTVKKPSGATGCNLIIDGVMRNENMYESGDQYVFTFMMTTVGATYNVQVQVLGGAFDAYGNYIIDSNPSAGRPVTYTE